MGKLFFRSTSISGRIAQDQDNNFSPSTLSGLRGLQDKRTRFFGFKNHKYSSGVAEVKSQW